MDENAFREWLLSNNTGKIFKCKKNHIYTLAMGVNSNIWFVEKGVIMSMISADNGMFSGNAIFKSNDMIGISAFDQENRTVICKPLTDAVLRSFSSQQVDANLLKNIDACHYMLAYNCRRFLRVMQVLEGHLFKSIEERITDFEQMISEIKDEGEILISDATLAMYLGNHPVSISRARKRILGKEKEENNLKHFCREINNGTNKILGGQDEADRRNIGR